MNQWYRKTLTKAVVLLTGILSGAAFVMSLGVAATFAGTVSPVRVMRLANEPYEESEDFNAAVENSVAEVFEMFRLKDVFETEGAYDPDKEIDIMEYADSGKTHGSSAPQISYTLDDLLEWGEDFSSDANPYDENVVVCQKKDESYHYYYLDEFIRLAESGDLVIRFESRYQSQASFLRELSEGNTEGVSEDSGMTISDGDGKELYIDCWNFGSALKERSAPAGAENLLEAVNASPELNGRLSEIYDALAYTLSDIYDSYMTYEAGWEYLEEGNTNFTYLYVNRTTKQVFTNKAEYAGYRDVEGHIREMKTADGTKYLIVYPKLKDFESNLSISASGEWTRVRSYESSRDSENILAVAVDTDYPIQDQFYEGSVNYHANLPFLKWALFLFLAGGALFLVSVVWLGVTAGRRPGEEKLYLTGFDRWKTELAFAAVLAVWAAGTCAVLAVGVTFGNWWDATMYYAEGDVSAVPAVYSALFTEAVSAADVTTVFFYGIFSFTCFFAGYVSLVRRAKAKLLWKGSLLHLLLKFSGQVAEARSVTVKAGLAALAFFLIQWFAMLTRTLPAALLALAADVAAAWIILSAAMAKSRIKKGIEEIAAGNLEYRIDLKGLRGAERDIAEKINHIGTGLNKAIDEAMRNERLKTDLITNVSHDIKTPLTSIINYVDILKRSNISDAKIRGYLDILEAKAQRLKTLTEDVVEASKVSSGNISLEYMDMDLRELVQQTEGEMAEKFAARNLTMVLNLSEEPAVVHVDGRRMWRVLENIFGNAAKYAMPGTRVYADLTVNESTVEFSLKNVSEQQLNISADELTERFIRGDISRSTEGSGLGLSIAKSLTVMQGGEFELYLDGDLFRVNIRLSRVRPELPGKNKLPE